MREIKFRVWIYDNLNKCGAMYYAKDFGGSEAKLLSFFENRCKQDEDFLMQFTGIKDENSKEIYEGDIIKLAENTYGETELPINCVVKWNDKGFYQLWRNGIIHWKFWREDTYHNTGYRKEWEIIGTIHTTPELMEGE